MNPWLREIISNHITEVLELPPPIICADAMLFPVLYKQVLPAIFITSFANYHDKVIGAKITEAVSDSIRDRIIVISDNFNLNNPIFAKKFEEAILYCLDEPSRIMNSICLVGVTMSAHCRNPQLPNNAKIIFGIKRVSLENIKPGYPYFIITHDEKKYCRYVYPSNNSNQILAHVDKKLTPDEYICSMKVHEIHKKDIAGMLEIRYEYREF